MDVCVGVSFFLLAPLVKAKLNSLPQRIPFWRSIGGICVCLCIYNNMPFSDSKLRVYLGICMYSFSMTGIVILIVCGHDNYLVRCELVDCLVPSF